MQGNGLKRRCEAGWTARGAESASPDLRHRDDSAQVFAGGRVRLLLPCPSALLLPAPFLRILARIFHHRLRSAGLASGLWKNVVHSTRRFGPKAIRNMTPGVSGD